MALQIASNIVFTAVIKNCANKIQTVSACIEVSKKPKCGTIKGNWPTMTPSTPHHPLASLSYLICPEDDASLEEDISGQDCIINWEYTDNPANPDNLWIPVGSSTNTTQHTNILLPVGWPGTCIYYRIRCEPLPLTGACGPIPSVHPCSPCYSNIVEICLWPPPLKPVIAGLTPICKGQSTILSVSSPVAGETYSWIWNGLNIGTGVSIVATEPGNYWVVAVGKCETVWSDPFQLTICCPTAKISCPLAPNECAYTNEAICFQGIGRSNCVPILNYEWQVNGVLQTTTSDTFCEPAGWTSPLTVTLIITDANGCLASSTIKIEACE
ncbi:MAG: hypothetical protein IPK46_04080 [Saprospiraceae bacterium]|nr:hypothetical protein [Saprospiraceae bacterium]